MMELLNKDCKEVLKELEGKKICIVTDPPFNVGYHYNKYNDKMKDDEYYDWLKDIFTSNGFPFVVIHYPEALYRVSAVTGKIPERVVSWVYNSNTAKQHRDIAFFDIKPDFNKVKQPYKNLNDRRIKERMERGIEGGRLYDWWEINQVKNVSKKNNTHPCVMPVEVMRNIVGILPEDYIIFDPFMGSGTTAVACEEMDRDFIGCEIDEEYYNIAKERVREVHGNKQKLFV